MKRRMILALCVLVLLTGVDVYAGVPATVQDLIIESERTDVTEDEIELLAKVIEAEAGNQDSDGKRLVVDVVLNRMRSSKFPDTVTEVIYQPRQFSCTGVLGKKTPVSENYTIIAEELESRYDRDVVFFRTGRYSSSGVPLYQHGDHYFSKLR